MMRTLSLSIALLLSSFTFSQSDIPSKKDVRKAKQNSSVTTNTLLTRYKNWEQVAFYDYKSRDYKILDGSLQIIFIDSNTVNYVTTNDKLTIEDKNNFEVIYGGSGPERQTFEIINMQGDCLILESKGTSKGYLNGKLVWRNKSKYRIVWRLKK